MGIGRINMFLVEEFSSPGDLRFRVETDVRLPKPTASPAFHNALRKALESSPPNYRKVLDLLLKRLERPLRGRKRGRVTRDDRTRVRRLVVGALSDPRRRLRMP